MNDNETIDGLLAEMRKISAEKYRLSGENGGAYGNPGVYYLDFAQFAHVIAERLDAAHKREHGDCAKLREALAPFPSLCDWLVVNASKIGISDMVAKLRERGDKARAALAAPPRNCDKYPTFNDAIRALADKRGWHDEKWDSERYCILASWLFAPATEKEGSNGGR